MRYSLLFLTVAALATTISAHEGHDHGDHHHEEEDVAADVDVGGDASDDAAAEPEPSLLSQFTASD